MFHMSTASRHYIPNETAAAAMDRQVATATALIEAIQERITATAADPQLHWGHVGDVTMAVENLQSIAECWDIEL